MAKTKMLKFGGPKLKPGEHTWIERFRVDSDSPTKGLVTQMVYPGDLVPMDAVVKDTGLTDDGEPVTEPNADYYVQNGLAEIVNVEEEKSEPAPAPGA